ncbi:GrpB family protein [Planctomonas sp. JC2975]|uniref:GrpB family protein n=1 Tax=Planctomonas sp. JC2975 TaxID=2729626 RepID=UPI00197B7186|nr:GrpB family protein [Planctomonas sp. JC2975]
MDRIHIEDYDPAWPSLFHEQQQALADALCEVLVRPIEHIGSTSVPGLPAKPIIDMLAVVRRYEDVRPVLPILSDAGWRLAPEPGDEGARKYSLCFPSIERRTHHLHVVEPAWGWRDLLLYRDYLRAHPQAVAEYAILKRRLAALDDEDRPKYRAAKAPFIKKTLEAAKEWQPLAPTTTYE